MTAVLYSGIAPPGRRLDRAGDGRTGATRPMTVRDFNSCDAFRRTITRQISGDMMACQIGETMRNMIDDFCHFHFPLNG